MERLSILSRMLLLIAAFPGLAAAAKIDRAAIQVSASSADARFPPSGAMDGNRFGATEGQLWKGGECGVAWELEFDFGEPVSVGSLLQILGDDPSILAAAPLAYRWQASNDGANWRDLEASHVTGEQRMFRVIRFSTTVRARFLRLAIESTGGAPPAVREVEFYSDTNEAIEFPDWVFAIGSEDTPRVDTCHRYLDLAHQCPSWESLPGQYVWHGYFNPAVALPEPRPLAIFYTGNHRDWCEIDPKAWRGTQEMLANGSIPMWSACGGCQAFALLEEHGCDVPWDCPNCRDPNSPKSPIYGHIGLLDPNQKTACGIYTNNVYEKGPTPVRRVAHDPVFRGLPDDFLVPEYHCGQVEYLPAGWDLLVTRGKGGKTWMQCMRKRGTCVYAAQFHIELQGTPEVSRQIMSNFLAYAKQWNAQEAKSVAGTAVPQQHVVANQPAATNE